MPSWFPFSRPLAFLSAMAPKGGSKQQSEEDLLLQDFSRNLSAKSSALFFGNAFIVSAIPICELRAGGGGDVAGAAGPGVGGGGRGSHSRRAGRWVGPASLFGPRGSPPALPLMTC